jgi:flagellar biogenesis protein FliO
MVDGGSSFAAYLLQTLLSLVLVCGLAVLVLYAVRRLGGPQAKGPLALVGQLPLGGSRAIYVVRVGAQHLVVGAAEGGLSKLGELGEADAALFARDAARAAQGSGFAGYLARARARSRADATSAPADPDDAP